MEKVYGVWCGEFAEDRVMVALFKSKELAEHYANEYSKLEQYETYYVMDYEFQDDKFSLDTVANKYYHADILFKPNSLEFEVDTDELWDDFLNDFVLDGEDKYNPEVYKQAIESVGRTLEDEENNYALSIEYMLDKRDLIVEEHIYNTYEGEEKVIRVFSRKGYHEARRVALDYAQKYIEAKRKNNG